MKSWEYMCERLTCDQADLEQELDRFGRDGWELCASPSALTNFQSTIKVTILIFKREISNPPISPDGMLAHSEASPPTESRYNLFERSLR